MDILIIFWQHPIFFGYLIIMNVATFFIFVADKLFATAHAWRVRERTLLILALIGGSLGALIAMNLFRHKTKNRGSVFCLRLFCSRKLP